MKLLQSIGFIIKYLLIGLGIAALFIVFLPEKFSKQQNSSEQTENQPQLTQKASIEAPSGLKASYADMLAETTPSVVSIKVRSKVFSLDSGACAELEARPPDTNACAVLSDGSGVIIDGQGHIVTNAHVLDKAATVIVELKNGAQLKANIVGGDIESDIALLKVDAETPQFLPLPENDQSRVGDLVFAIGTPSLGFHQTVTQGIISAKFFTRVAHYIQTDAALRPGNSGGALVNANGELIGITSLSTLSNQGEKLYQSYAVSANNVRHIVEQIKKHGQVHRGWLGLSGDMTINLNSISYELGLTAEQRQELQNRIYQLPFGKGVVVTAVAAQGPAEQAGLKPLDIITEVNNKPIYNAVDLTSAIWNLEPGAEVTVNYMRDGTEHSQTITLGQRGQASQ
ncbi:S1C family serine protease [Kangiella spongicola]|uniref:Signaling protein n=1 Tax=Kangiella spongicola TaxID=796379 RepID=A0A318D2Z5_9GAMM|nr:trypsin-like peptidase domain-containing protein [Kangiella spongicola]PXF63331.1 signaling protein [Kangiella spongicola]